MSDYGADRWDWEHGGREEAEKEGREKLKKAKKRRKKILALIPKGKLRDFAESCIDDRIWKLQTRVGCYE